MTGQRREQLVVGAAIAALWALLFVQAWQTPTLLDDWIQLGWYRGRELSLELFAQVARYNHRYDNPRIGDLLLFLVNGPRAIHLVVTPIAELLLLWTALIAALGRRPRLCYGDLALALVLQVLIWLASPIPGVMYFYRPYTANYLFAFTVMLCWFAPYRLALARPPAPPAQPAQIERWWPVPMLVLGWLAGMSNEHTGPAAIGAVGVCLVYAWRHRRLRIWMIAGAIGLGAGYAMLMIAPGHGQRYAGRAARFDTLGLIASRGVSGNYDIVAGLLGEAGWAIALTAA
ncbi:MAG TPA: DUF6056 family protein, partial [Kofleriaceae bacterium]|nr:DUF6056 family protein [Kofleriaceae bacterium]